MMEVTNSLSTKMGSSRYLPVRFLESMGIGYRMYLFPIKNCWIGYMNWPVGKWKDRWHTEWLMLVHFWPFGCFQKGIDPRFWASKKPWHWKVFFVGTSGRKTSELLDVSKAEKVWPNHQRKYSNIFCRDASYSGFWNEDVWISNFKSPPLFEKKRNVSCITLDAFFPLWEVEGYTILRKIGEKSVST